MYQKVDRTDAPRKHFARPSLFESSPEWAGMKADIDKGIKPAEVLQLSLTAKDYARIGLTHRKTIFRFIKKYVQDSGRKYIVKCRTGADRDFILVEAPKGATR